MPVIVCAEIAGRAAFADQRARRPRRSISKMDGSSAGKGVVSSGVLERAGLGIAVES
jgi:hypothetical protein